VAGNFKTEAVVLRSIRFGEADRILHLYTSERGRVNAIAKGSRRPKSRFGGRLEPFFRLDLLLHEGRSDLMTVTGAATVCGYPNLRASGPAIGAAARACDAVLRLLDTTEPNRPAYNLLCRYLELLDDPAAIDDPAAPGSPPIGAAAGLAFRLKLALATGFVPELASCARCGEAEGITSFSGAAGGVVCAACEGGGFALSHDAHEFMVAALGQPLSELPAADAAALRQVERAIGDVLSYHAHVKLRAVA
jgi:DNA repair protein RecO (recombination protein O)